HGPRAALGGQAPHELAGATMTIQGAETPKIHFDHVRTVFELKGEPFVALDDFDLTIGANEFVTVVGPSGCGKSTAMNAAAGLLMPTSGVVHVDGEAVTGPGPERGVIFQQYALFPWLTVRQNIEFGLELQRIRKPERREISDRMIELAGL